MSEGRRPSSLGARPLPLIRSARRIQLSTQLFYQHAKRPEWGVAVLIDALDDRRIFLFNDGVARTFVNDYALLMNLVELDEESAADANRFFDKHKRKASSRAVRERKPATAAKKRKSKAVAVK